MLNWKKIKENYPRSYERFVGVMFPYVGVIGVSTLNLYEIKKLYYFFDKEKTFLTVERLSREQWLYTISLGNGKIICPTQTSVRSREDAEIEGFTQCFRLLHKHLEKIDTPQYDN